MEDSKDTMMTENSVKRNASTDQGLPNNEGGFQMKKEYNINEEWTKSPLRKARYQVMKNLFQRIGGYILDKGHPRALESFGGWTREQIEQALDDVILCGHGKVHLDKRDAGIVIKFVNKE